jgi:hypothetical protein
MGRWRSIAGTVMCGFLVWASPAAADVVVDWNLITFQTAPATRFQPVLIDYAMVHLAMHDAIQAFEHRYEPYGLPIAGATGSPIAAAATAAHDVLANRFPSSAGDLATTLNNYLSSRGLLGNAGINVGHQAASQIIAMRVGTGDWPSNPEVFTGGTEVGEWRPTPPAFAPMQVSWLGSVVPFTLKDSTQLRPSPPPPHLTSGEYARDYNEVKAFGRAGTSARTQAQTDLATFYSDNFITLWQRTLRGIGGTINNLGDNARLFALAEMAATDAVISAWDTKKFYNFWRPLTAIQQGAADGNRRTDGDPNWAPFLPMPPYPEYTSGANALTGSITRTLAHLLGDKTTFSVFSTPANGTITYDRFSDMADDVVDVRVYQGIHFRFGDEVGRRQGTHAADWAISHFLRPLD